MGPSGGCESDLTPFSALSRGCRAHRRFQSAGKDLAQSGGDNRDKRRCKSSFEINFFYPAEVIDDIKKCEGSGSNLSSVLNILISWIIGHMLMMLELLPDLNCDICG